MKRYCLLVVLFCSQLLVWSQSRFALLSDLHVTPGNDEEKALKRIVKEVNASEAEFVVITGDLTNQGADDELQNVKGILSQLQKPWYVVPGNHETVWSQSATTSYNKWFGPDRFSFIKDATLYIGFNTGPYMKMGDGHVKHEDIVWLEKELKAQAPKVSRILAFCHYPYTSNDLGNAQEVVRILRNYNVNASFCGHGHSYVDLPNVGIKNIMARSVFLKKDTIPGYSVVTHDADKITVWEKKLAHQPSVRFQFGTQESKTIPTPERAVFENVDKDKVVVTMLYQDEASIFTGVALDKQHFYFGNSLGKLKAVSKKASSVKWEYVTPSSLYSTPIIYAGSVIQAGTDNYIHVVALKSGKSIWKTAVNAPIVADGVINKGSLYQGGFQRFYKIDPKNGKLLWEFKDALNYCQAQPVVVNDKVIFGVWDTNLYCLNSHTGTTEWKWSNGKKGNLLSPGNCVPVVSNDKVFIVAPDRYMTALQVENGQEVWRTNANKIRESQGISQDGAMVYGKTMDGVLVAVPTKSNTYELAWQVDLGFGYDHAPCPIIEHDGLIYVGSRHGWVAVVDQKTHELVLRFKAGNSEVNQFAVDANGEVYFSMIEGKVYKITKK